MQLNLAVVCGTITNEPVCRELADGSTIVQFDVRITSERDGRPATASVPISWRDPAPAAFTAIAASVDADVLVVGRIERRFFRSGGLTQSRTELVAERCLPARRSKSVRSALAAAAMTLDP